MQKVNANVIKSSLLLLVLGLFQWGASSALALTIHYSGDRTEALRECDQLSYRGDEKPAARCYQKLLDNSEGLNKRMQLRHWVISAKPTGCIETLLLRVLIPPSKQIGRTFTYEPINSAMRKLFSAKPCCSIKITCLLR